MINEAGIDIEENSRFELERNSHFLLENFTEEEIEYCFSKTSPQIHLCGIFCAKEALKKIINEDGLSMKMVEIKHGIRGKPEISLKKDIETSESFKVSISHTKSYSVAIVIKNGR